MTKCDFCANCTSDGICLGHDKTHKVGDGEVRYCDEAIERFFKLKYTEMQLLRDMEFYRCVSKGL